MEISIHTSIFLTAVLLNFVFLLIFQFKKRNARKFLIISLSSLYLATFLFLVLIPDNFVKVEDAEYCKIKKISWGTGQVTVQSLENESSATYTIDNLNNLNVGDTVEMKYMYHHLVK